MISKNKIQLVCFLQIKVPLKIWRVCISLLSCEWSNLKSKFRVQLLLQYLLLERFYSYVAWMWICTEDWVFQIYITLIRVTESLSASSKNLQCWQLPVLGHDRNTLVCSDRIKCSASDCLLWALCQGILILADKLLPEPFCWISFVCIAQHFTGWGTGVQMLIMLLFFSECITKKDLKLWRIVTYNALAGTE